MTIQDIYKAANQSGLVRSKRHFSKSLLGRAHNYLADTATSGCSAPALLNLYRRLGELGEVDLQAIAFQLLIDAETRDAESRTVVLP